MQGAFVHLELHSDEISAAKAFYARLFGWSYTDIPMGESVYTMIGTPREPGAGMQLRGMPDAPSMWLPYITVHDVRATVVKARDAGAEVIVEYMEAPGFGAGAILRDPTGATFGVWKGEGADTGASDSGGGAAKKSGKKSAKKSANAEAPAKAEPPKPAKADAPKPGKKAAKAIRPAPAPVKADAPKPSKKAAKATRPAPAPTPTKAAPAKPAKPEAPARAKKAAKATKPAPAAPAKPAKKVAKAPTPATAPAPAKKTVKKAAAPAPATPPKAQPKATPPQGKKPKR